MINDSFFASTRGTGSRRMDRQRRQIDSSKRTSEQCEHKIDSVHAIPSLLPMNEDRSVHIRRWPGRQRRCAGHGSVFRLQKPVVRPGSRQVQHRLHIQPHPIMMVAWDNDPETMASSVPKRTSPEIVFTPHSKQTPTLLGCFDCAMIVQPQSRVNHRDDLTHMRARGRVPSRCRRFLDVLIDCSVRTSWTVRLHWSRGPRLRVSSSKAQSGR